MNSEMNKHTHKFDFEVDKPRQVRDISTRGARSLKEKGYNPISQLVGYILSGDQTYITSHKNARSIINRVERDEIIEELVKAT